MNVRQHIPSFCDFDHSATTAATMEELLNIEFIKRWPETEGFYRFSQSPYGLDVTLLMAEFDFGTAWWVVAYLTGADTPEIIKDLPRWEKGE